MSRDYGEPWTIIKDGAWIDAAIHDARGTEIATGPYERRRHFERIVEIVNALAGVEDPAAYITQLRAAEQERDRLREALIEARDYALNTDLDDGFACEEVARAIDEALHPSSKEGARG